MENIIELLLGDRSLAIAALLLGNLALCGALAQTWRWHRRDREQDTERWVQELERQNQVLGRLTEALTDLRMIIAQCSGNGRGGARK